MFARAGWLRLIMFGRNRHWCSAGKQSGLGMGWVGMKLGLWRRLRQPCAWVGWARSCRPPRPGNRPRYSCPPYGPNDRPSIGHWGNRSGMRNRAHPRRQIPRTARVSRGHQGLRGPAHPRRSCQKIRRDRPAESSNIVERAATNASRAETVPASEPRWNV